MGRKDSYQYDYLDDNRRFADQVNGALFGGKQVVRPEEFRSSEEGEERYDMCKAWEDQKLEGIQQENLRCAKSFITENVARKQSEEYIVEMLQICFLMKEEDALALYRECESLYFSQLYPCAH